MTHRIIRAVKYGLVIWLAGFFFPGCVSGRVERIYQNPYPYPWRVAVAPFMDQSGSGMVDTMAATDEFYTELQQISGLQVTPVNRVQAVMLQLQMNRLNSPADAMLLADALEVDGVIVGTITRYNPYYPPLVGMVVQLYSRKSRQPAGTTDGINPAEIARAGKQVELELKPPMRPEATIIRIFDASQNQTVEQIKQYAELQGEDQTPYGWRKVTLSRNYLRFVSYEMIGELLAQQRKGLTTTTPGD